MSNAQAITDALQGRSQGADTPEERAAFLRWYESQGAWSGTPCAVAYASWLAGRACNSVIPSEPPPFDTLDAIFDSLVAAGFVERGWRGTILGCLADAKALGAFEAQTKNTNRVAQEAALMEPVELEQRLMGLVDDYADAFHAAMRPDGGMQAADGFVAKVKKDLLRNAIRACTARSGVSATTNTGGNNGM